MLGIVLRLVCSSAAVFLVTLFGIRASTSVRRHEYGPRSARPSSSRLILGIVNTVLKPIIKLVGCGLYLLTLGLVSLVVNGFLFWLCGVIVRNVFDLQFYADSGRAPLSARSSSASCRSCSAWSSRTVARR